MKKHGHNLKKTLLYKNPDIHEISGFFCFLRCLCRKSNSQIRGKDRKIETKNYNGSV